MFFKFTTAGESHGRALVAIIEGLPAGLEIDVEKINFELFKRQQGYGRGGRQKIEKDEIQIVSGVRHGQTLGSPIALTIENRDFVHWQEVMSAEKLEIEPKNPRIVKRPRPGHADLAGGQKFGARDLRDILERASARETAARVACGAFAKQLLAQFGVEIKSHVIKLGSVPDKPLEKNWEEISALDETSPLRCADKTIEKRSIFHTAADFDGFHGLNGHKRLRDSTVEFFVPGGVRPQTDWRIFRHDFKNAAERIAVGFCSINQFSHLLFDCFVGAAQ